MAGGKHTEYYETLEVSTTCTETELKKSYRRLCLIHHPDKSSTSDSTRFQSIQNAYEVLSDPDLRADYDQYGSKESRAESGRGGRGGRGEDVDEMFASMFDGRGGGGGGGGGGSSRGPPPKRKAQSEASLATITVSLEDLYLGREKKIDIERTRSCASCHGSGAKPKTIRRPCQACEGRGMVHALRQMGHFMTRVPIECSSCEGAGTKIRPQDACKKCRGKRTIKETKRVEFFLERGRNPGEKIILQGEGDGSPDYTSPGDLIITLSVTPHPTFTLRPASSLTAPSDLSTTLSLTLSEALLGFSRLILVHLDGRGLRVTQPGPGEAGWRHLVTGDWVVVKEEGMWRAGMKGDLWLKIEVEMPSARWAGALSAAEIEMLTRVLPPKRVDLENPAETDEVEFVKSDVGPASSNQKHSSRTFDPMHRDTDDEEDEYEDEEEEEDGGPQCQQQ